MVAIAGPPNAGKSTLLNRIARREAAIVSPYAGTTRDVIEVHLDLGGLPVTLLDTAGIRETDDPVEMEGVRRARERAASADLVLWVVDASAQTSQPVIPETARSAVIRNPGAATVSAPEPGPGFRARPGAGAGNARSPDPGGAPRNDGEKAARSSPPDRASHPAEPPIWLIRNKIDLVGVAKRNESSLPHIRRNESKEQTNEDLKDTVNQRLTRSNESLFTNNEPVFVISATTGEGFDPLFAALARHAESFLAGAEPALVTRERHRRALEDALAALCRALAPDMAGREDLLAEELRIASRALGRLTGRVDVEDILDVIFRDFCIGK